MFRTAELKKHWVDTVRIIVRRRQEKSTSGIPLYKTVMVSDVAKELRMDNKHVYRRLEKLVEWGYLKKSGYPGHCNTYAVGERSDQCWPEEELTSE